MDTDCSTVDTVRMTHTVAFPSPPAVIASAMLDERYLATHCRLSGALDYSVSASGSPRTGGETRTRRVLPTDRVPDFARRLTGDTLVIVEVVGWWAASVSSEHAGTVELRLDGAPVRFRGEIHLAPAGEGTRAQVSGTVTARVPLVGGRIERALLPAIRAGFDVQPRAVAEWLAD